MPNKAGRLGAMERRFTDHYGRTGNAAFAAEKAGYAHAGIAAAKLMARPAVASLAKAQLLENAAAATADGLAACHKMILDPKETSANKIKAFAVVKSLYVELEGEAPTTKELHEMTADEVAKALEQARDELDRRAGNARDVTPDAQSECAKPSQPLELLG